MRRLLILVLAAACSRASDDAKKLQASPPFKDMAPPSDLSIAVEVNGKAQAPITATALDRKPDFQDAERKAWLISSLVAEAGAAGTTIEVSSPTGVTVKLVHPTPDGLEPVLFLTRRGEVIASTIDPKDPFPPYHGRGGRLHRAGDQMPHVGPVAKLAIVHAP
jgi:hypothetical protein